MGSDLDKRMSVLGPHVFDGVPLMRQCRNISAKSSAKEGST